MTVSEMIELLNQYPQSAEVEFSGDEGETPICDVEEEDGTVYLVGDEEEDEEEG
jgi:hypothetical protein